MSKPRECLLQLASGYKGVGKTHQTLKEIIQYAVGNRKTGAYPRKVLIFDINDEYGDYIFNRYGDDPEVTEMLKNPDMYRLLQGRQAIKIKAIAPEHIEAFSAHPMVEIRRVRPFHTQDNIIPAKYNKKMELVKPEKVIWRKGDAWEPEHAIAILMDILKDFRGGLLLVEDLSSVFGDTINRTVAGLITRNRHRDLDIIMHLQSVSPILPRFWQNTNLTRYHYQMDNIDKSKRKLPNYQMYKIVEALVDAKFTAGDKRYFVYVNNAENRIEGSYSEDDLRRAIKAYLSTNFSELKELNNYRDENGYRVNDYPGALKIKTDQLYNRYKGPHLQ